jgi:hypothetical protein
MRESSEEDENHAEKEKHLIKNLEIIQQSSCFPIFEKNLKHKVNALNLGY